MLEPEAFFAAIESGATKSDDPAILAADKIVSIEFTSPRTCLCKVEIAELNEDGEAVIYTDGYYPDARKEDHEEPRVGR